MTWNSEVPGTLAGGPYEITLPSAGTYTAGTNSETFDLTIKDVVRSGPSSVPDAASTALLLGIPAALLLMARRKLAV